MSKDTKQEPSFPEPFEHFNQEMAADIQQLRLAEQKLGRLNNDLAQAKNKIKDIGPSDSRNTNLSETVSLYQKQIRETEQNITQLKAKTYGQFEQFFKKHDVEPELANQVMQVLDEKVNPDKHENRTREEDKQLSRQEITIEPEQGESEISNNTPESREHANTVSNPKSAPKDNNYKLSLFLKKEEEQAKLQASIEQKTAETDKNVIQKSLYLNYQLKSQKPVFKETPIEKKSRDFSKNSKDIFQNKE